MGTSGQPSGEMGVRVFATTHWSVVLAAGEGESEPARCALEILCTAYWYPIYVYVRRKGNGPDDAQDLTQGFFTQLITKEHIRQADRSKGRFRTFLLGRLDNFILSEWKRAHRQKRGSQFIFVSLDEPALEERYRHEPADNETPEKIFMRQWALTVLRQAMGALEAECAVDGKAALFREVKNHLAGERDRSVYAEIGRRLGMTDGAVRVATHRLRQRYGELLRRFIAQTVSAPDEVEEELSHLLSVLSG